MFNLVSVRLAPIHFLNLSLAFLTLALRWIGEGESWWCAVHVLTLSTAITGVIMRKDPVRFGARAGSIFFVSKSGCSKGVTEKHNLI
ncbi:hypothetical protein B0H10DRAFT_2064200, partial [Mycena sp. CBHHK59/15]